MAGWGERRIHEKCHEKGCFRDGNREFGRKFTKNVTIPTIFVTEIVNRVRTVL